MRNQSFDYVVADAFAAAVNVKVWVNYKESCQLNLPQGVCVTFPRCSLRSLPVQTDAKSSKIYTPAWKVSSGWQFR